MSTTPMSTTPDHPHSSPLLPNAEGDVSVVIQFHLLFPHFWASVHCRMYLVSDCAMQRDNKFDMKGIT